MKISYDPDADAMSVELQKGEYEINKEIAGDLVVDLRKASP